MKDTWKVGWMRMEAGSLRRTMERFIIESISKELKYFRASFFEVDLRGMSLVASQTRWPGAYCGLWHGVDPLGGGCVQLYAARLHRSGSKHAELVGSGFGPRELPGPSPLLETKAVDNPVRSWMVIIQWRRKWECCVLIRSMPTAGSRRMDSWQWHSREQPRAPD